MPVQQSARRTFLDYKNQVLHAIGNPDVTELDIQPEVIVNDAIEHIVAMNEWLWTSTGQCDLDITGQQDFVELPADFGTLIALEHDESWTDQMIPVSWQTLIWFRQHPIRSWTSGFFYVINTGNVETGQEDAGLSLPTLNLYPTPFEDQIGALKIVYRRFLRRLENDADRPQWPAYMDRPLSLLARSFASTDYDDDPNSAYSSEFRSMIVDCMAKDGNSMSSFGVAAGAVHPRRRLTPFGYPDRGIPDPVVAAP